MEDRGWRMEDRGLRAEVGRRRSDFGLRTSDFRLRFSSGPEDIKTPAQEAAGCVGDEIIH